MGIIEKYKIVLYFSIKLTYQKLRLQYLTNIQNLYLVFRKQYRITTDGALFGRADYNNFLRIIFCAGFSKYMYEVLPIIIIELKKIISEIGESKIFLLIPNVSNNKITAT